MSSQSVVKNDRTLPLSVVPGLDRFPRIPSPTCLAGTLAISFDVSRTWLTKSRSTVARILQDIYNYHRAGQYPLLLLATAVTHIAIQEQLDGKTAEWMEKVSDDQYQA